MEVFRKVHVRSMDSLLLPVPAQDVGVICAEISGVGGPKFDTEGFFFRPKTIGIGPLIWPIWD